MAFRMMKPRSIKKKSSKDGQEVLDRLQSFLDSNSDEPVEILYGFWKDQQNAISYPELREAVKQGKLSEETFELWQQDYSTLVAGKFCGVWQKAIEAGVFGQPVMDQLPFTINMTSPGVMDWISDRGANFVKSCTQEQKDAIKTLLADKVVESHTVDELARLIRPCIGLTKSQTGAVQKHYDNIVNTLKEEHPRMKAESIRKKALNASQKYAERLHRERAFTIAQTENALAFNRGADQGVRQAQEQGLLGTMEKRWCTAANDNVCTVCNDLEGTQIGMDEEFDYKGKVLFEGHKLLPPAHPRCVCAVMYIEVKPPRFVPDTAEETAV